MSTNTPSRVYRKEYIYTIADGTLSPPTLVFRALSKRQLEYIRYLARTHPYLVDEQVLGFSITDTHNIKSPNHSTVTTKEIITLPKADITSVIGEILRVSTLDEKTVELMEFNTGIVFDSRFQTDTWKCKMCQERGLDKERNCKLREDYDELWDYSFKLIIKNITYTDCPMVSRDDALIGDMLECYSWSEKGILPDEGSLVDQTEFYTIAVNMVNNAVNDEKARAYEANK